MSHTPKKTPSKIRVAPGHLIIDRKWKDTFVSKELESKFNRVEVTTLGICDFYVSDNKPVVYIAEGQLITQFNISKLQECISNTIFIADRNTVTIEHYSKLQDHLVIRLGYTLFPIGHISELASFIYQLSIIEGTRTPHNQFKRKSLGIAGAYPTNILLSIPCLNKEKCQKLLDTFGTVYKIAFATHDSLARVVGASNATQVIEFFNK